MTGLEPNFSRVNRKKGRKRSNNILNILIGVVVVLIVITATTIFLGGDKEDKVVEKETPVEEEAKDLEMAGDDEEATGNKVDEASKDEADEDAHLTDEEQADTESDEEQKSGILTYAASDDDYIAETIINTSWEPIGTEQKGKHVSVYDGKSIDWKEKQEALAYATGLSTDAMIFWKIKNGGSPQKSVGIVSSKDSAEKYRVYLEWVDEEGWQPVKMDVLTTLDFNY